MKKYAIISTWNGEGYSYLNTAEILEFQNDEAAQKHLRKLFEADHDLEDFAITEGRGFFQYSNGEDTGSFEWVSNAEQIYGLVIYTNVNEINVTLTSKEWANYLADAIKQSNPEDFNELDLSQKIFFIAAHNNDYDYQFIRF